MKTFLVPFSISGDAIIAAADEQDAIRQTDGLSLEEWARMGELIVFEESVKETGLVISKATQAYLKGTAK